MRGDFVYYEDLAPSRTAPAGTGKGLRRLIIAAAVVIAAELIWLFAVSPCMPLESVEISAFSGIDRSTVLSLAGIESKSSWFTVDAGEAERRLESHHRVESARVLKRFPDRVKIFLVPRTPAAMCFAPLNERTVPVYFDHGGMIIGVGGEEAFGGVPILSGLLIDNPVPGMHLPALFGPLLENIEKVHSEAPELLEAVSEIRVNRKPFDGFDLVMYPVHNPVKVRLGPDINEDTLRYALLMIDVFESQNADIEEIDFRTATASYVLKEASPGE
jgi:cell division protein FtsQ